MSDRIRDAFQKVKTDIDSVNKKVDRSEKKKVVIERELLMIKQKMVVEEELRDELSQLLDGVQTSLDSLDLVREEFNEKVENIQALVKSAKQEFRMNIHKVNEHFEEIEKQVEEGVLSLGNPLKKLLNNVEKKVAKEEKREQKLLERSLKEERKATKKKGIIGRVIDSLSDE